MKQIHSVILYLWESQLIRKVIWVAAIINVILHFGWWLPFQWHRTDMNRDLVLYYTAVKQVLHHAPLYIADPHYGPHIYPFVYIYPPQFAVVISPLGLLSYQNFCHVWLLFLDLCFWGYAATLSKLSTGKWSLKYTLIWGYIALMTPDGYHDISTGQVDSLLWLIMGLALTTRLGTLLLALAAQIKPYAIYPLLALIYRRSRRVWIAAGLLFVAGIGLAIAASGPSSLIDWVRDVGPVTSQGTFKAQNVSIPFAVLRLLKWLGIWHYHNGPLSMGPRLWLAGAGVIFPILTVYLCRKMDIRLLAAVSWFAALIFSPLCWIDYLPVSHLILALLLRPLIEKRVSARTESPAVVETVS